MYRVFAYIGAIVVLIAVVVLVMGIVYGVLPTLWERFWELPEKYAAPRDWKRHLRDKEALDEYLRVVREHNFEYHEPFDAWKKRVWQKRDGT